MSETQEQAAQPSEPTPQQQETASEKPEVDWKAKSREWERRAKANADAASELQQLREAQMSAEQKAAEREAAAERRAVEAEARAIRREIALENKLSKEDAALLDAVTDEDAIRLLAKRLAPAPVEDKQQPPQFRIDQPGQRPDSEPSKEDLVRAFFGL
jgi:hypothetical protein